MPTIRLHCLIAHLLRSASTVNTQRIYRLSRSTYHAAHLQRLPHRQALQLLHRVDDALLEPDPLDAQNLVGRRVVVAVHLVLGRELAALDLRAGQPVDELGEVLPHDRRDLAVGEPAGRREEAPAAGGRRLERAQLLHRVDDALLEPDPLDAQNLVGRRVVVAVHLVLGRELAALDLGAGQPVGELGKVLAHDGRDLAVGEPAGRREEAPAGGGGGLEGAQVGGGAVADVDPQHGGARVGDAGLPCPAQQLDEALVGRVDGVEAREVGADGAQDERRADGDEVKGGRRGVDKVPGRALGELLGGAQLDEALVGRVDGVEAREVGADGAQDEGRADGDEVEGGGGRGGGDKVPGRALGELLGGASRSVKILVGSVTRASSMMEANEDVMTTRLTPGAERWRAWRMAVVPMTAGSMRSFFGSAVPCQRRKAAEGPKEEGRRTKVKVEWRRRVQHSLEPRRLDDLVKRILAGNVRHNGDRQASRGQVLVVVADLLRLVLGTHRHDSIMTLLDELLEDVAADEAGAA
ncbi:hypothetical protein BN1723_008576 [Verticillium longisporum]|uniref:Uncharacterized protein n=1 Tax=Verticillium longisporum TaxID=100787 RepID=A0A0G4KGT2_VERLO|nr:hypothetical protein BN1723_008576 [Verticillium longisporum]